MSSTDQTTYELRAALESELIREARLDHCLATCRTGANGLIIFLVKRKRLGEARRRLIQIASHCLQIGNFKTIRLLYMERHEDYQISNLVALCPSIGDCTTGRKDEALNREEQKQTLDAGRFRAWLKLETQRRCIALITLDGVVEEIYLRQGYTPLIPPEQIKGKPLTKSLPGETSEYLISQIQDVYLRREEQRTIRFQILVFAESVWFEGQIVPVPETNSVIFLYERIESGLMNS